MNNINTYIVEARSYSLKGIASHNFWVLRDDQGKCLSQLHGLATDRKTNRFKPIGFFNDRLGFYEFKSENKDPTFISVTQKSVSVYTGEQQTVLQTWNKASCRVEWLNRQDLNYSPFGVFGFPITNSNSAYHLFARLMGIECCRFSGVIEPGIKNSLANCLSKDSFMAS